MNQVNYALQIGTAVANFFQKEFDMDYLLPKIGKHNHPWCAELLVNNLIDDSM